MFWGFWKYNLDAYNYYKAYITKLNETHLDFALKTDKGLTRSYPKTKPVLILDEVPLMKDIAINSPVIAQQTHKSDWYRTGNVTAKSGSDFVRVKFDGLTKFNNKHEKWVKLENLRLMKRPSFC